MFFYCVNMPLLLDPQKAVGDTVTVWEDLVAQ